MPENLKPPEPKFRLGQHITWQNSKGLSGDGIITKIYIGFATGVWYELGHNDWVFEGIVTGEYIYDQQQDGK